MKNRTVRELGGEVWAEITARMLHGDGKLKDLPVEALHEIIDLMTAVLARYKGTIIEDDAELPVVPLEPYPHILDS